MQWVQRWIALRECHRNWGGRTWALKAGAAYTIGMEARHQRLRRNTVVQKVVGGVASGGRAAQGVAAGQSSDRGQSRV